MVAAAAPSPIAQGRVRPLPNQSQREALIDGPAEPMDGRGELIFYERPDSAGPKLSSFTITPTADPEGLQAVLAQSLGTLGTVTKERLLLLLGQTRLHLDRVQGLGDFLELEVVLRPEQSVEDGQRLARELLRDLGIGERDLVCGAYLDLLLARDSAGTGRGSAGTGRDKPQDGQGKPQDGQGQPQDGRDSVGTGRGSPRTGRGSPRTGRGSPRMGRDSVGTGRTSPRTGRGSPRMGRDSPRTGMDSPRMGRDSRTEGWHGHGLCLVLPWATPRRACVTP
ncbi:hypothetical protein DUI87_00203 [Hirundo rustica rustica]|uniref:CYTH domain-containing protein n=1 Tax=Hirundo rustica rustica TaxID=333673 RepID=A0A3M0LB02_HIRRU|nr:hypothetical protein DUI87_00203 [Hirundo rustica rustica]